MLRQISSRRMIDNIVIEINICEECGWAGENNELVLWGNVLVCGYCGK